MTSIQQKPKGSRKWQEIFNVIKRVVTALLLLAMASLVFIGLSPDYDMFVVKSESMKPALSMGDVIVTGILDGPFTRDIKAGSIISYVTDSRLITHRVTALGQDGLITKGDAAEDPDPKPVKNSQITGVYLFKLLKLGYLIYTKPGWFLLVIVPVMAVIAAIIKEIIKEIQACTVR